MKARGLATAVAAAVALLAAAPASAIVGEVRTLVILGTWGPERFTQAGAERVVFGESAPWLARSSFGRLTLAGETTPWLRVARPPDCDRSVVSREFEAAAVRAGYSLGSYDRLVYLVPDLGCPYSGYGQGNEAFLMDALGRKLVVHELGHTFGLGHAKSRECDASGCTLLEYGDRFDTMGSGGGDFNAFEKVALGWIDRETRVGADGIYTIEAVGRSTPAIQALVIETARNEFWLDHRDPELDDPSIQVLLPEGNVFVHGAPPSSNPVAGSLYSEGNVLVPAVPFGRQPFVTGERFAEAGAFELTVLDRSGSAARVAFRWTDRARPTAPRLLTPGTTVRRRGGPIVVWWTPSSDRGSGVARYEVRLDAQAPVTVVADFRVGQRAEIARPGPGRHTLRLIAVDRAGNRSAVAVRRFTVRR